MITLNQLRSTSRLSYLQGYAEAMRISVTDDLRDVWEMFADELDIAIDEIFNDIDEPESS
jgi:hypothetical protein